MYVTYFRALWKSAACAFSVNHLFSTIRNETIPIYCFEFYLRDNKISFS